MRSEIEIKARLKEEKDLRVASLETFGAGTQMARFFIIDTLQWVLEG